MSQADTSRPSNQPNGDCPPKVDEAHQADLHRRLRAAGIDPEGEGPEDMDAFRIQLARMIAMFQNEWHGCPERICQRNRGCMAPDIVCANVEQPTPEQMERDWPQVQAEVYKALKAHLAAHGEEEA